jgi:hypothetical protein
VTTGGVAIVLLGLGVGVVVAANRSSAPTTPQSPRARADALRVQAADAQLASARASQIAREITARWSVAEDAARKEEGR